jgi:hypothetical protein
MRPRGQGVLTLVVAGAIAVGVVSFDRLGAREPSGASPGTATSSTWLCPHGGGKAYEGSVFLANPGEVDVTARVSQLDAEGPTDSSTVTVPAGFQVEVAVDASGRSSATFVETFGGWLAAGWVIRGAEGEVGIGAEACVPRAGRSWVTAAATTGEGDDAFLVVMNPFDIDAVFDVVLFAADRAPVRDSELTDVTVGPRRTAAIRLNDVAQGEEGLGVSVMVSSGRLAASTLVVSRGRGIGSVVASAVPSERRQLLTSTGTGRSVLAVTVPPTTADPGASPAPGQLGTTFAATLRSQSPPQPAGGLSEQSQEPESAATYPITTTGPSAIDVVVEDGAPIAAALRTAGVGNDGGATAGVADPGTAWIVTPTVAGEPARPGVLVLNTGQAAAAVDVTSIPVDGRGSPRSTTVNVRPGSVTGVPRTFLDEVGNASLLVSSEGVPIVPVGASTSLGNDGWSVFGLAAGVPVPESRTP